MYPDDKYDKEYPRVKCFVRKNAYTINESPEIFEIVKCSNDSVVAWGTAEKITILIGPNWKIGDTVYW